MQKLITKSKFSALAGVNPSTITRLCLTVLKRAVVGKKINAAHPDAVAYLENRKLAQVPPAATGLDPLYEMAVARCREKNRYTIAYVQREIKVGFNRAARIVDTMRINGLIPVPGEEIQPVEKKPSVSGSASNKQKRKKASLKLAAAAVTVKEPDEETQIFEIPDDIEAFADMTLRELLERFGTDTAFVDWLSATQKIEAINEKRLKNAQTKGTLISRELVKVGVIDTFNSAHLRLLKDGAKSIAAGVISKNSSGAELSEVEAYVSDILGSFIKPIKNKIARVLKNA